MTYKNTMQDNNTMQALLAVSNDSSYRYEATQAERETYFSRAKEILKRFGYNVSTAGLDRIFEEWRSNKGYLINLLKKHPNYVANEYYVKIPATLTQPIDKDAYMEGVDWIKDQINYLVANNHAIKIGLFDMYKYMNLKQKYSDIWRQMREAERYYGIRSTYNGMTMNELWAEITRMDKRLSEAHIGDYETMRNGHGGYVYVPADEYRQASRYRRILGWLPCATTLEDEETVEHINKLLEEVGARFHVQAGQKVTKIVGKIAKLTGVDKIVRMTTKRWRDENTGELREREVDMGWNHYRAKIGDAISPATYTKDVYISVNPIDYWMMSIGNSWGSCHQIDIHNIRGSFDRTYQGCHSAGTESYMLDSVSVMCWVSCSDKELKRLGEQDKPACMQSKFKRAVVFLDQDKIVFGRLYPDGRDGGDESIAGQLRQIVQAVVAKCLDTTNMWTLNIGTVSNSLVSGVGPHYPDYNCCSDTSISYLKRTEGYKNRNTIKVGHWAICPNCGDEHREEANICCSRCQEDGDYVICANCGESILAETAISIDGYWYCDGECAEADGYVYCVDDEEWHRSYNAYYCEYAECYYYSNDDAIVTEDGYWFPDANMANYAGCIFCTDGNVYYSERRANSAGYVDAIKPDTGEVVWVQEDEVAVDGYTEEVFVPDDNTLTIGDSHYMSADNARNAGWELHDDGTAENTVTGETLTVEVA